MTQPGSLAYRRNAADIWDGRAPEKYLRLLPYITGRRILEIGAAEGVQSLLIADRDPSAEVMALEMHRARHEQALALQARWRELGMRVDGCTMVLGDITERLDLFAGVETFVAIRTIYHLGGAIESVFRAAAQHVHTVVLVGNPNRAKWHKSGSVPHADSAGPFNYYASVEGMTEVLEASGFSIGSIVTEGDPIVTGHR